MGKFITLLSGKGGSGKTTLALSMASLFRSCGLKTLLIDVDMSTNGATFFYEDLVLSGNKSVLSFIDILGQKAKDKLNILNVSENLDFIPSMTNLKDSNWGKYYLGSENYIKNVSTNILSIGSEYDIILIDCQAGYNDLLKIIMKISDINLVVMEADAISSAAVRNLYLKTSELIESNRTYQLFNKVSSEEREIYSKISGGTIFPNITTIGFDWKVRKAFAVAKVPDIENNSIEYGKEIFDLCKSVIKNNKYLEKLDLYKDIIEEYEMKKIDEENRMYLTIFNERIKKNKLLSRTAIIGVGSLIFSLISAIYYYYYLKVDNKVILDINFQSILILSATIVLVFLLRSYYKDAKFRENERVELSKKIRYLEASSKEKIT